MVKSTANKDDKEFENKRKASGGSMIKKGKTVNQPFNMGFITICYSLSEGGGMKWTYSSHDLDFAYDQINKATKSTTVVDNGNYTINDTYISNKDNFNLVFTPISEVSGHEIVTINTNDQIIKTKCEKKKSQ